MKDLAIVHNSYNPIYLSCNVPHLEQPEFVGRELEILLAFCSDLSFKEIAAQHKISTRTVQGYRNQLCNKLGLNSRIGLVLYAIKHGLYKIS
jgi:DNA-binding NarL/FixJ family response regulator